MGAGKVGFRECDPTAKPRGRGCIFENNEDVMAMGNLIRPVHSTPFLFGLKAVTGLGWKYWTRTLKKPTKIAGVHGSRSKCLTHKHRSRDLQTSDDIATDQRQVNNKRPTMSPEEGCGKPERLVGKLRNGSEATLILRDFPKTFFSCSPRCHLLEGFKGSASPFLHLPFQFCPCVFQRHNAVENKVAL